MHIADGILPTSVWAGGALLAAAGTALGLRTLDEWRIPRAAVMSSAFFVASLIHVPVGPGSVHLVLNGLIGLLLGWAAFPAILLALLLQAVMFGHGGFTTLGVNAVSMAAPAVAVHLLLGRRLRRAGPRAAAAIGFAAGAGAVALSCAIVVGCLLAAGRDFALAARVIALGHVPVMLIEGAVTAAAVGLLRRVRPELLDVSRRLAGAKEPARA